MTLWFRNTWSGRNDAAKPVLRELDAVADAAVISATHHDLGDRLLYCEGVPRLLFTENESNNQRLFGTPNPTPWVKDAFNELIVHGRADAVNPNQSGTKAAAHYQVQVAAGASATVRLRLTSARAARPFGKAFDELFSTRLREADEFYRFITPPSLGEDRACVMRQALAGMLWSKQFYSFEADRWLGEHGAGMLQASPRAVRNRDWFHMVNDHVISMPDKWEYPWYAAWDLAFHAIAFAGADAEFREAADRIDAQRALPASERADSGL
jgi:hypothetical protein